MSAIDAAPSRRTRPKHRKQQILAAAEEMFVQQGFPNVTMNAIAQAVGITAGALYRHFPNKAELLAAVVRQSLESFPSLNGDAGIEDALKGSADAAVRHRELGALWTRQLGYLPDADQAELRSRLKTMNRAYADLLHRHREGLTDDQARLLAWSVQAVLSSPGTHSITLPAAEFAGLLADACRNVCAADLFESTGAVAAPAPLLTPASRRELLLQSAIRLFGAKGVHATSMEDIGAAAGVTGPSLYTHFSGKDDILAAALARATHALWLDLGEALQCNSGPRSALSQIVAAYVRMTLGWLQLTSLVLADSTDESSRAQQREYVGEWVALLRECRPGLGNAQARVLVHAALGVIHDISRRPALSGLDSTAHNLTSIALAALGCA